MIFDRMLGKKNTVVAPSETLSQTEKKRFPSVARFSLFVKKYKLPISLGLLGLLLFFVIFRQVGFLLVLTALAIVSRLYERFLRLEWGIELVTMAVVLTTIVVGPFMGALIGIVSLTISVILNHPMEDPKYLPTSYLGLTIGAYVVSLFSSSSLLVAGMAGTIAYNLVIDPLAIIFGARTFKVILFAVTNIAFNYFAFTTIAPLLMRVVL